MSYFVQRSGGKIVGLYRAPQPQTDGTCLTDPDPLPDDHAEVVAFLTPTVNAVIDGQIRAIELREIAPRFSREAILVGILKDYMRDYGVDAATGLSDLTTVGGPRYNAGFTRLKALDDQIRALRAQRQP